MNKAVLRALNILELIANSAKDLTVTEIAKQLGLPKSTTHNILQSLLEKEYILIKDQRLKTYEIGLNLHKISNKLQNGVNRTGNSHSKCSIDKEYSTEDAENFLLSLAK